MHVTRLRYGALSIVCVLASCVTSARPTPTQAFGVQQTSCVGVSGTDLTVYDTTQVAERPSVRVLPELTYPDEARQERIGGRVLVSAIFDRDGRAEDGSIAVVESVHPLLDAEAIRFVREAQVWPACRNRQPVRLRMNVPVEFALSNPIPSMRQAFLIGLLAGAVGGVAALVGG